MVFANKVINRDCVSHQTCDSTHKKVLLPVAISNTHFSISRTTICIHLKQLNVKTQPDKLCELNGYIFSAVKFTMGYEKNNELSSDTKNSESLKKNLKQSDQAPLKSRLLNYNFSDF